MPTPFALCYTERSRSIDGGMNRRNDYAVHQVIQAERLPISPSATKTKHPAVKQGCNP